MGRRRSYGSLVLAGVREVTKPASQTIAKVEVMSYPFQRHWTRICSSVMFKLLHISFNSLYLRLYSLVSFLTPIYLSPTLFYISNLVLYSCQASFISPNLYSYLHTLVYLLTHIYFSPTPFSYICFTSHMSGIIHLPLTSTDIC